MDALRSIFYGGELEEVSENSFKLEVFLDEDTIASMPKDKEDIESRFSVFFKYTETYPDSLPVMEIDDSVGLEEEQIEELGSYLKQISEENLGMPMVFTVVSSAKEWLENVVRSRREEKQRAEQERIRAEEEAERRRFEGTKVTIESFTAWNTVFIQDLEDKMAADPVEAKKRAEKKDRLSGRQQFEKDRTLVKSDIAFMGDNEITVDIELFEGLEISDDEDEEMGINLDGLDSDDD